MPLLLLLLCLATAFAAEPPLRVAVTDRSQATGPTVLCVVAHPDDEIAFAGLLYKLATQLDGAADIALITNGEGGFKYSTLAEDLYGLELTDEAVGRQHLPRIRQAEFLAGVRYLQLRDAFFFRETDHRYSQDPQEVLAPEAGVWDLPRIEAGLAALLAAGSYDLVLTHLPVATTHGHHQAASILALHAVQGLPAEQRPLILAASGGTKDAAPLTFTGLPEHPETTLLDPLRPLVFDRTQPFGHRDRLDYRIVVNWVIAEHKSQGTMQLAMNRGEIERYWPYAINPPDAYPRLQPLFDRLAEAQFETRTYGPSAGTNAAPR